MYDVIIIGSGPAGISASLYTARANLKTLVIGLESSLAKSRLVDNYYGFKDGISGYELLQNGWRQAEKFKAQIIEDEVIALEYDFKGVYTVKTKDSSYNSRSVLLSAGSEGKKAPIKDIEKFEGKGVHYCTTCDGYFYRGKKVGILGYSEYALNELNEMKHFTDNITLLTDHNELTIDPQDTRVETKKIYRFEGGEYLDDVVFEDGTTEKYDGIFVAFGKASSIDFARKLGIVLKDGIIETDKNQRTNIEGLYAAGDCSSNIKQIAVAVGQGAVAGLNICEYIRKSRR